VTLNYLYDCTITGFFNIVWSKVKLIMGAIMENLEFSTLVQLLQERAQRQGERVALHFLADGEQETVRATYADLDRQARIIGGYLQHLNAAGERVMLLYPAGVDYVAAFMGTLYAGAIAVPAYPPRPKRPEPRLPAMIKDATPAVALTNLPDLTNGAGAAFSPSLQWVDTTTLEESWADAWRPPVINSETLAFLQYTSGSTSLPKGVMLTHGNLLYNLSLLYHYLDASPESRCVSWLPPYHDMGLIAGILSPIYGGYPMILMPPGAFLQHPLNWLRAISRYRGTITGGPDFAYALCVHRISPQERASLDLSSWRVAASGAEPVRRETISRFTEAFAPCGFRPETFYPCYGLAEATLIASGGAASALPVVRTFHIQALGRRRVVAVNPEDEAAQALVGCGKTLSGQRIVIADPDTGKRCEPDQVGEIWVSGPSVAQGYWQRPEPTAQTFQAYLADTGEGPFLRTGDLGFLDAGGELFIAGRIKDLIIIRGRNYYPQDIELTVANTHPAIVTGRGAAFSVDVEGEERLVVVQEVDRQYRKDDLIGEVAAAIRSAISETYELQVYAVVLISPWSIPTTTSGKVQRHMCRQNFLEGSLKVLSSSVMPDVSPDVAPDASLTREELLALAGEPETRQARLTAFLQAHSARVLRCTPAEVGAQRSLSALGLDSLRAVELKQTLETQFGTAPALADLLQGPTIAELAEQILAALSGSESLPPLEPAPEPLVGGHPLSRGQQALWFLHQLAPESAAYNVTHAIKILGLLDSAALRRSFQALVARHPALRTTFAVVDGTPVQTIHAPNEAGREFLEWIEEDVPGEAGAAEQPCFQMAAERPFDLAQGPLLRVYLRRHSDREHSLLLVIHHIVSDFWSLALLFHELEQVYSAECAGTPSAYFLEPARYVDYVHWQEKLLAGAEGDRLWQYWQRQLAGVAPSLDLPTDHPRPAVQTYHGAAEMLSLPPELTQRLKTLSQDHHVTLFTTLLAAFQTLLYRYTGQTDILVGSPTAGRARAEFSGICGYFVNPVVLRSDLSGNPSFTALLAHTWQQVLGAFTHQDYPFELLVERLHPQRDLSRSPLFQVLFTFQQSPLPEKPELAWLTLDKSGAHFTLGPLDAETLAVRQNTAQFDLNLIVADAPEALGIALQYNCELFEPETARRMVSHFQTLLSAIVNTPQQRLAELPLLDQAELRRELETGNATQQPDPAICLHEWVTAQARRTPDAIAVRFETQALTYAELERQSDALAAILQSHGVGLETLVGLRVERSPEMVAALLAILKAGGAYIPLAPVQPSERLALMLADARPLLLLTQRSLAAHLPPYAGVVLCLDELDLSDDKPAPVAVAPDNLAYVIYTSGSTGHPKGVQIPHRAVVNFLHSMQQAPGLAPGDRLLSVTTLSFDIAGLEIFLPLVTGATVVLVSRAVASDGHQLARALDAYSATVMQATPATWQLLLETGWTGKPDLKVLCGGEAFPHELARQLLACTAEVWNMYGPTETTIWSMTHRVTDAAGAASLGGPIANTQIYLLDGALNPEPPGVVGELYIGGAGLARGYVGQPAMTARQFIPDPFSPTPGARLYRTGDLARRRVDGAVEYIGRADFQVKIRGFRIELGEIEAALAQHPAVRHALVVATSPAQGDRRLAAYVIPATPDAPPAGELRAFLKGKLPDYMIPSAFVPMTAFPLTTSGKVDRRALPPAENGAAATEVTALPQTALEKQIAAIWQQVLQVERVGLTDNFFDLGGHSLLVAKVHTQLLQAGLAETLTMVELFQYPTVQALARYLSREQPEALETTVASRVETRQTRQQAVAIIGLACRFPQAEDAQAFWRNLREGVEAITFFSDEELAAAGVAPELLRDPAYVKASGALNDVECFDAHFFGYSPNEAALMDPQQRLFLEQSWKAVEDAGYNPETYPGLIGVYGGMSLNSYLTHNLVAHRDLMEAGGGYHVMVASDKDFLATKVAYKLNLRGPAVTVQTACSTSLVAVHLACQSLRNGECDMALAGGASVRVPQRAGYRYHEGIVLSPDGHCRAFAAGARGTVLGSGAGVVVLKLLDAALADGDHIYAVIAGSTINNDGALKAGYTAPSLDRQAAAIAEAQGVAGVSPDAITYIEAHGTGTPVGDPIEIAALTKAFRAGTQRRQYCAVGSVKTNIGHLDAAAGVAGLIKVALMCTHAEIPPSLNFTTPNPQIDFANSPFFVNTHLVPWQPPAGMSRLAGISSFGIGGTNAHVIVEQAPDPAPGSSSRPWQWLPLSAKTAPALEALAANLATALKARPDIALADVAYTLQTGRKRLPHRRAVVCRDVAEAIAALEAHSHKSAAVVEEATDRPVAFLCTGQGAQYANMGRDLYETEPVFRKTVDECAEDLRPALGLDLRDLLYPAPEAVAGAQQRLAQTALTQPALFVVEYALARLLESWGIRPAALLGHSLGGYVAATLAGVFTLEDALALVAARGRLIQALPGGAMLAVPLPESEVLAHMPADLSLAAINGVTLCTVSGPHEAVAAWKEQLAARGVNGTLLNTSHAFHSTMVEPILEPFRELVSRVTLRPPAIPVISDLTGDWLTADEATDPETWVRHLRQPVRFADGLQKLFATPDMALLEIGPGGVLTTLARRHPHYSREQPALAILRHARDSQADQSAMPSVLGSLWQAGVAIDWQGFYAHEKRRRVSLPGYPFEKARHWIEPLAGGAPAAAAAPDVKRADPATWFYQPVWQRVPTSRSAVAPSRWLIFEDAVGLGAQLAAHLEQSGGQVVTVTSGDAFAAVGERRYTLPPASAEGYTALLAALREQALLPQTILHLWSLTPETPPGLEAAQEMGFYSLLFLAQAIGGANLTDSLRLLVVSNGVQAVLGNEWLCPEKATLLGPVTIIPYEYPQIRCSNLDVVLPGTEAGSADAFAALVEGVLAEANDTGLPEPACAYRGAYRWRRRFAPAPLAAPEGRPARLREQGVYLLTGGLGGVALTLARYLADTLQARLVLLDRAAFPPETAWAEWLASHAEDDPTAQKIRQLRALQEAGAAVLLLSADVADPAQASAAGQEALRRFGRLDGVFHAAGAPGGGLIQRKSRAQAAAVLAPKVQGTLALEAALRDVSLDFVVLFSSVNALVGRAGQADYCAANAFLDALAQSRGAPWLSINWETWQQVGMAAALAAAKEPLAETVGHPLLDRHYAAATGQELFVTSFSVERQWALHEHGVIGRATLPGTAYLELARAAWGYLKGVEGVEFQDVYFLTPLLLDPGVTRAVYTLLEPSESGYAFSIMSRPAPDADVWYEHARGKLATPPAPLAEPLAELERRCAQREIADPLRQAQFGHFTLDYRPVTYGQRADGTPLAVDALVVAEVDAPVRAMAFGPRWHQSLREVKLGAHEGLARFVLPETWAAEDGAYHLHPALLDFATSFLRLFLERGSYLPLAYRRLRCFRPLVGTIYSYARFTETESAQTGVLTCDVALYDEAGQVLAVAEEFAVMKVEDVDKLGALAHPRPAPPVLSGGLRSLSPAYAALLEAELAAGLTPDEGAGVLARVLDGAPGQVVVSTRPLAERLARSRERGGLSPAPAAPAAPQTRHPRPDLVSPYAAPRNESEEQLVGIWQDVLGVEPVGIHDNFFDLGGDSLLIAQVHSRFQETFKKAVSIAALLQHPTVAELGQLLAPAEVSQQALAEKTTARAEKQKAAFKRFGKR